MKDGDERAAYYPVFLSVAGRRCVVVGGGPVARRKVQSLLECGAAVAVISPELDPGLERLAVDRKIEIVRRAYKTGDLKEALLAVAATGDGSIDRRVAAEAGREKVLVNVVDDARDSDFIVPSSFRRGDVVVAVSTAGQSPALARKIRTMLEENVGEEYSRLAQLVAGVRAEARQRGIAPDSDDWQEALDIDSLLALLRKGETQKARDVLLSNLEKAARQER